MKTRTEHINYFTSIATVILLSITLLSCTKTKQEISGNDTNTNNSANEISGNKSNSDTTGDKEVKVTFVELGSVNCIPCKQMQPIMKSIEEKYKGQVKVVFHDVWKDKAPAQKYGIQLIPTQVFLDENGKEFFRHEGFFPEEEIDKLLLARGVNP